MTEGHAGQDIAAEEKPTVSITETRDRCGTLGRCLREANFDIRNLISRKAGPTAGMGSSYRTPLGLSSAAAGMLQSGNEMMPGHQLCQPKSCRDARTPIIVALSMEIHTLSCVLKT